jgi:hypothetical protein
LPPPPPNPSKKKQGWGGDEVVEEMEGGEVDEDVATCPAWSGSLAAARGRGDAVTAAAHGRRACEERRVMTTSR